MRNLFIIIAVVAAAGAWAEITNDPGWAVGGTVTVTNGFVLHAFTNTGATNFIVTRSTPLAEVEILVVGGGGGGGGYYHAGGGGAGGVVYGTIKDLAGSNYIFVGTGGQGEGSGNGSSGADSKFGTWTAYGGGGGGVWRNGRPELPLAGGSGGGSAAMNWGGYATTGAPSIQVSGSGYTGYGNAGGAGYSEKVLENDPDEYVHAGGGGGGAGGVGLDGRHWITNGTDYWVAGGDGGPGIACDITGSNVYYAGGGAGSMLRATSLPGGAYDGKGGVGGGGDAGTTGAGEAGEANTGGGGGAALALASGGYLGGDGGSGVVMIRYFPAKLNRFSVAGKSLSTIRGEDLTKVRAPVIE